MKGRIGIISPYKAHVSKLRAKFATYCRSIYWHNPQENIEIDTVDAF